MSDIRSTGKLGVAAVCAALSVTMAAPVLAQADWDNVIAAAKKEGVIYVYQSQHGTPHWLAVVKDFETRYGVKVQVYDARASEMTEKIRVEQTSGRYLADRISVPATVSLVSGS